MEAEDFLFEHHEKIQFSKVFIIVQIRILALPKTL